MCLLVMQEQNTTIKDKNLKNAYDSNPDGVGYSFINSKSFVRRRCSVRGFSICESYFAKYTISVAFSNFLIKINNYFHLFLYINIRS